MSNQITNLCRTVRLTPPQKCVLMALADRADDTGLAWPSIAWLCEWTCFGKTAVIEALKGLESARLITNIRTTGRNNQCTLHVDRIAEFAAQGANTSVSGEPQHPEQAGDNQSATRANLSATRTSPPHGLVRETDYHPSATRTTTSPSGEPTRPPDGPDTSLDISNTSKETRGKRVKALAPSEVLEVPGVPRELMVDYVAVRKAKRAGPFTITALAGLQREADKAGLSLAEAITECCEAGWQGFKADWYARRHGLQSPTSEAPRARELAL